MEEKRREKESKIASESQAAYEEGLHLIYNFFRRKSERIYETYGGNKLYQAAAILCRELKMGIVPYNSLLQSVGESFSVEDIARMSRFPCRKIVLEPDWYKKDCGSILAWMKAEEGDTRPVVCVPARWGGYDYLDSSEGIRRKLDDAAAEKLHTQAYMVYKPFPNEKMTAGKLIRFALEHLSFRDRVAYLGLSAAIMLVSLLLPFLTQIIYDEYIGLGEIPLVLQLCLVILVCNISGLCFGIVRDLAFFRGISSAKYAVQAAVYDRLFHLPDAVMRQYEAADLGNRVSGISQIFDEIMTRLGAALLAAVCAVAYLAVALKYSAAMALYGLGILLIGILVMLPGILLQKTYVTRQAEAESRAASFSYQLIDGASKIKLAGAENKAGVEYLKRYLKAKEFFTKSQKNQQLRKRMKLVITTMLSAAFYYAAINRETGLTIGAFLGFVSAFGAFSNAILGLVDAAAASGTIASLYDRVKPVLQNLPEIEEQDQVPEKLTGKIEVDHVTFSYSQETEPVLRDLSFGTEPGEYIGIVGPSGCGKSTLVKVLLGFEKPDQGKIYYDKYDMMKLNRQELRKQMGVVLQDGKVFAGSIYENVTLASAGTGQERVMEALKAVGLEEDLGRMPMGIHTYLSEGGSTISGGQQQRILIARAILGNPGILIFDEATSALDNVTQEMVCESLEKLHTTRIVIAHRLSTIRNCDRILVMDKGQIVEEGTYEQLLEKQGLFYELVSRQVG